MADIHALPIKRARGRPKRSEAAVCYTLRLTRQQAAYLTYLAEVAGWAESANAVAKLIIAAELRKLSKSRFHERGGAFPTDIDDSGDEAP